MFLKNLKRYENDFHFISMNWKRVIYQKINFKFQLPHWYRKITFKIIEGDDDDDFVTIKN